MRLIEPVPYIRFMSLVLGAGAVITDSGGLQEETTYLGIPCFTLRENTERPITIEEGTNVLATPATLPGLLDGVAVGAGGPRRAARNIGTAGPPARCVEDLRRRDGRARDASPLLLPRAAPGLARRGWRRRLRQPMSTGRSTRRRSFRKRRRRRRGAAAAPAL